MGDLSKQFAIYISLILVCAAYTMIAPFYPSLARSKGVPIWLIGVIFSTDPLFCFFTTVVLSKRMKRIGRKIVLIASLVFLSMSMFVLCPVQYFDLEIVLILSFLSRMLAGMAAGCVMTAAGSIFAGDYPDKVPVMMGRMQGAIGTGLVLGPLLGTVLYFHSLFLALLVLGTIITIFIPLSWRMLGPFSDYEAISSTKIKVIKLLLIPVITS